MLVAWPYEKHYSGDVWLGNRGKSQSMLREQRGLRRRLLSYFYFIIVWWFLGGVLAICRKLAIIKHKEKYEKR